MAQHPVGLEPRHVPDLPQQRVDNGETWTEELVVVEVGDEIQRSRPGVAQVALELGRAGHPGLAHLVIPSAWHLVETRSILLRMRKIIMVSPTLPAQRTGNGITAARWAQRLREVGYAVRVTQRYDGQDCSAMIALHTSKSAPSARAF